MGTIRPLIPGASLLRRRCWDIRYLHACVGGTSTSTTTRTISSVWFQRDPAVHVARCSPAFLSSRRFSSSRPVAHGATSAPLFRWLDLDGAGLSMMERLTLEEAILNNTQDNWILVGRHAVWPPKHISIEHGRTVGEPMAVVPKKQRQKILDKSLPDYIQGERPNPNGMIVMGIGGKAEKLLNSRNIIDDQLLVVKRFSGGGTVVMDENAIWTTIIAGRRGKNNNHQTLEDELLADGICKPYPRDIMKWTADAIFASTFDRLKANQNNFHNNNRKSRNLPVFSLQEDDYVLTLGDPTNGDTRKMGGNAQAIKGKQGWLHHTSFLWDYEDVNMERYLKLPEKRPDYRTDRSHKDFLVKLKEYYGSSGEEPSVFVEAMKKACGESLGILESDWPSVFEEVFEGSDAAMNVSWLENRTRIQHEL